VQHIEMARDFGARFNHVYGEHFTLPEAAVEESVATLPGLDGRKMSKSYDNTIPLFAPPAELKKLIASIKTDSRAPGQAKAVEGSALFQLYQAFARTDETEAMRRAYADGIAWGEAKQMLFDCIDREVAPMREKYEALIAKPVEIEATLREGAAKARKIATPFMAELRRAVGLRPLHEQGEAKVVATTKAALPMFKQYREADGKFYFKFLDAEGALLLQSRAFDSPKDPGAIIVSLRKQGEALTPFGTNKASALFAYQIGGQELVWGYASIDIVRAALIALREAEDTKS